MAVAAEVAATIVARAARMLSAAAAAAVAGSTRGGGGVCCSAVGADHGCCAEVLTCGCVEAGPAGLLPGGPGSSGGALPLVPTQLNILSSSRWNCVRTQHGCQ